MSATLQRRTLYALLSELELDLRDIIADELLPTLQLRLLTEDERIRAFDRFVKDRGTGDDSASIEDLLSYLDLGDLAAITLRHASAFPRNIRTVMQKLCGNLVHLIPIRNRVMHSRPLEFEDFTKVIEFSRTAARTFPDRWRRVRHLIREIRRDPYYVSNYPISIFDDDDAIFHNLPSPDFDDTGFIGRHTELTDLLGAIKGPYPVITVIGEGGVGKTALALKACYALLDDTTPEYDAIIWVTAKANRLTPTDIEDIDGAINTSMGLIEAASNALFRQHADPQTDLYLNLEYHRILLVIDNLETVLDDNIRAFVKNIPARGNSKILITTRVGLGAYDFPIRLSAFAPRDSRLFFRRTAKVWQVNEFVSFPDDRINLYCDRLHHSPLFIKWFMQTIRAGRRPESILADPKIILQYCLQNVFNVLSDDAKMVAWTLLTIGGSRPQSTIVYVSDLSNQKVEVALTNLLSANVISMRPATTIERDATYALSELARFYMANYMTPKKELQEEFIQRSNILRSIKEEFGAPQRSQIYSVKNIALRGDDDIPAALALRRAVDALLNANVDKAIEECSLASSLSPSYFEVKHVEARIAVAQGNYVNAENCYSAAIALAPNHAPLRLFYSGFLTRNMQDHDRGLEQLRKALELDPEASFLYIELARIFLYKRLFDDAEKALNSIVSVDALTLRQQRQLLDLRLQIPARRADTLVQFEKYDVALEQLEKLKEDFQNSERRLIDNKTISHVRKAMRSVLKMWSNLRIPDDRKRLEDVFSWLQDLSGEDTGDEARGIGSKGVEFNGSEVGIISSLPGRYGFIDSNKGTFFFHGNSFVGGLSFADVEVGDRVIFDMGYNHKGPCAINVRMADTV